ncbi:MAG: hypothetical protein JNK82_27870 [Myxococcaceae bacterium]|nr:hypothetical protein [Myxococcaceae bacterium]
MRRAAIGAAALGMVLAGCATIKLPADQLEKSQATIKSAEVLGADKTPSAKLHLQFAKDEQQNARDMADRGDERAFSMLACSQADADLAVVLAQEAQVRGQAAKAARDVSTLKERGNRP